MTRLIVPIVEGHSEAYSIRAFLRKILQDRGVFDLEPGYPIREHRQRLAKADILVNRVRMALKREHCVAVLVIFDADDDAACELGPRLRHAIEAGGIKTPSRVVLAVRELESWLIAGIESLRDHQGIRSDANVPEAVEEIRGAKEWLDQRMAKGYKATIDQLPLLLRLDYEKARRRAPSLDKFLRDIDVLIAETASS